MDTEIAIDTQSLKTSVLFREVSDDYLAEIAKKLTIKTCSKNSVIFAKGDECDAIFLIKEGLVNIFTKDVQSGLEIVIASLGPGECFGETSILAATQRTASAKAVVDTVLYQLDRSLFLQIIQYIPEVGMALSRLLASKVASHSIQKGIPFSRLSKLNVDFKLLEKFPKHTLLRHKAVPIQQEANVITMAMVNPFDVVAHDDLSRVLKNIRIEPIAVAEDDFEKFMKKAYMINDGDSRDSTEEGILPIAQKTDYNLKFIEDYQDVISLEDKSKNVPGEQIVMLVNQILGEAMDRDTSDIHIEPNPDELVIRYRIDGKLWKKADIIPIRYHHALVTRLKVLARMDITEKRKPQDGRIAIYRGNRQVDFRASTLPTRFGEKMVLRLLDRSNLLVKLNRLLPNSRVHDMIMAMIKEPYGIIFITGPTGSGKTTTMYSAILERISEGLNIVTIEDPVEYTIPGINQVQHNEAVGIGFSQAIRAFLRQDPDIIMVGETRDSVTARNALTAALMGHLVFTSLHTNDALSTIYRLRDMGIEQFLIANAVVGIIYQRLLRRICPNCRIPHKYDPILLRKVAEPGEEDNVENEIFYTGTGCHLCNNTGFKGRVAAYEVVRINEEIQYLITTEAPMSQIKEAAIKANMWTLKKYCYFLLKNGYTTPQDVLRIMVSEDDAS
jgi:type IV pilus assembly protein PilB